MRLMLGIAAGLALAACASSNPIQGGPRPPQGAGPGGTEFGFWDRDAEGSVDADFRSYVTRAYTAGDAAKARTTLERDGFKCLDGNRPDGQFIHAGKRIGDQTSLEQGRMHVAGQFNDSLHAAIGTAKPPLPVQRQRRMIRIRCTSHDSEPVPGPAAEQ